MRFLLTALLCFSFSSFAQAPKTLTLKAYIDQVRTRNPEAIAHEKLIRAYEFQLDRGWAPLSPEFYLSYNLFDDRKPNQNVQFMGDRTKASIWTLGIRDRTSIGLDADLFVDTSDNRVWGASPQYMPMNPYRDTRAGLRITQSLWKNGFGEKTRAEVEQSRKGSEAKLAQEQFEYQMMLTEAENTYWELASYSEVVKLQAENVDRSRKLRDYMKKRAGMRLFDDVDYLQAQAGFESRDLEYQSSVDERASSLRKFNKLRGVMDEQVGAFDLLPTADWRKSMQESSKKMMHRGDFTAQRAMAQSSVAEARAARSNLRPQLDLVGSVTTTGRDPDYSQSVRNAQDFDHPTYAIGLNFSIGIDFGLLRKLRSSYDLEAEAAHSKVAQADFFERQEWQDALAKKQEFVGRFDRATSLENLYGNIVKRERQRLSNGRTTTFQLLKLEQDYAGVQIQRVRTQLALLQLHNSLKLFEER